MEGSPARVKLPAVNNALRSSSSGKAMSHKKLAPLEGINF